MAYNGWKNFETWNMVLWLDSGRGSHEYWQERAEACWDQAQHASQVASGIWTREEAARFLLADELKESHEEAMAEVLGAAKADCSVWADLLSSALGEVAWDDVAEDMLEGIGKEVAEGA